MSHLIWNIARDGTVSLTPAQEEDITRPLVIPLNPVGFVLYHQALAMGHTPVSLRRPSAHELGKMHLSVQSARVFANGIPVPFRPESQCLADFQVGLVDRIEVEYRHYKLGTVWDDVFGNYPGEVHLLFSHDGAFVHTPQLGLDNAHVARFLISLQQQKERFDDIVRVQGEAHVWDKCRQINIANSVDHRMLPHDEYAANYHRRVEGMFPFRPKVEADTRPAEVESVVEEESKEPVVVVPKVELALSIIGDLAAYHQRQLDRDGLEKFRQEMASVGMLDTQKHGYPDLLPPVDAVDSPMHEWATRLRGLLMEASLEYRFYAEGYLKTWRFDDGTALDGFMNREDWPMYHETGNSQGMVYVPMRF